MGAPVSPLGLLRAHPECQHAAATCPISPGGSGGQNQRAQTGTLSLLPLPSTLLQVGPSPQGSCSPSAKRREKTGAPRGCHLENLHLCLPETHSMAISRKVPRHWTGELCSVQSVNSSQDLSTALRTSPRTSDTLASSPHSVSIRGSLLVPWVLSEDLCPTLDLGPSLHGC